MRLLSIILCFSLCVVASDTDADTPSQYVFDESATMAYASRNALLYWPEPQIEIRLSNLAKKPVGAETVVDNDSSRLLTIPLKGVKASNEVSLLLKGMNRGIFSFFGKEQSESKAAYLNITTVLGQSHKIYANIDTYIQRDVRKAQGTKKVVQVGNGRYGIVSFVIPQEILREKTSLQDWQLVLQIAGKQFGDTNLNVAQLDIMPSAVNPELNGLAKLYPNDNLIESHSSVYFADNFNDTSWVNNIKAKFGLFDLPWGKVKISTISHEDVSHYLQEEGHSAIAPFRTNTNLALNLEYPFEKKIGSEPEQAYFRYYLKIAEGANVSGGGKLPGFAGTYNKAGWGGRGNTGKNGWSARGGFYKTISDKNSPWAGRVSIGQYIYEVGENKYGKTFPWGHDLSTLEPGRWYCIEQHLKLNTPGQSNGLLEIWIDGVKIYRKSDLYLRDTKKLKIEKVWLNFYFGGVAKPLQNFDMYIDNVVIAADYIGPVSQR